MVPCPWFNEMAAWCVECTDLPGRRACYNYDGDVTACCAMFNQYLKLGSLRETSLHEIWNSRKARDLRQLHKDGRYRENPICLKCSKGGGGE